MCVFPKTMNGTALQNGHPVCFPWRGKSSTRSPCETQPSEIVLRFRLGIVGIVQDYAELMPNKFGTGPTGARHGLLITNISEGLQFLHFL